MRDKRQETRDKSRKRGTAALWQQRHCAQALDTRLSSPDMRSGFTLTELMVVMVIIIVLTTMTIAAVNFSMSAERSRAGARQVQSYLAGARDRAIYERKMVGVRFLLDKNVPNSISKIGRASCREKV